MPAEILQTDKRFAALFFASRPPRDLETEFAKLPRLRRARRIHHQILSAVVLGKGHDVPNIVRPCGKHDETIHAQGDATVRRRAEAESSEQMREEQLLLVRGDAEHLEHPGLQIAFMNPDAAATDLDAVEDDVISLRADLAELPCLQQRNVFAFGARKRMVNGIPFLFLGAVSQQREILPPIETPMRWNFC